MAMDGVLGYTYRLREEDGGEEVVEDFADLEVLRDVLVMLLH